MPILFKCELCRARLSISRKKAGKIATCPKCGEPIHIPAISEIKKKTTASQKQPELESIHSDSKVDVFKPLSDSRWDVEIDQPRFTSSSQISTPSTRRSSDSGDEIFVQPLDEPTPSPKETPTTHPHSTDENAKDQHNEVVTSQPSTGTLAPAPESSLTDPQPLSDSTSSSLTERVDEESETHQDAIGSALQSILLPRWVVYFQAGLLGVVAGFFFIFGMMVGNLTSTGNQESVVVDQIKVGGSVFVGSEVDEGAVVIALPVTAKPDIRPETRPLHPDSFVPVDNESIQMIRSLGGDVIRTNRDGRFELVIDKPDDYFLLVISKRRSRRSELQLEKQEIAQIGKYFLPYQPIVGGKQFVWKKFRITSSRELKPFVF